MLVFSILATVLLSLTFILFLLISTTMSNPNGTAKLLLTLMTVSQVIGIFTIWFLYMKL